MNITILKGDHSEGPYTIEKLRTSLSSGDLAPTDLAWMPGMADWVPLSAFPGIKNFVSPPPPPPKLIKRPTVAKATLEHAWLGYAISFGTLTFFYYLTQFIEVSSTPIGFTCGLVLLASLIGTIVSFSMLLYKSWLRVAPDDAPLSPQRALGLMFIPLFNFYWQFRAVYGLFHHRGRAKFL